MLSERLQKQVIGRLPEQFSRQWGRVQKDLVEIFSQIGYEWKWLGWMMKFHSLIHIIAVLTIEAVDLASMTDHLTI